MVVARKAARSVRINQSSRQIQRFGRYAIPFPKEKRVVMEWVGTQAYVNPVSQSTVLTLRSNDLYDPDSTTSFGATRKANPFDQLLSADGPYRNYLVERWETRMEFINVSAYPVNIFLVNSTEAVGPGTLTRANSYLQTVDRDVTRLTLTQATGSKNMGSLALRGSLASMVADPTDITYAGGYNINPSTPVYTHLLIDSSMTGNNLTVYVIPRIIFYVKLYSQDAPATA